jgi:hypothetical protein
VPPEFLEPGTDYLFQVLAIEAGGNETISEGVFDTADDGTGPAEDIAVGKPTFEPNVSSCSCFFSFTPDSRPPPDVRGTARYDPGCVKTHPAERSLE